LAICLPAVLALFASGCGSTKTASTPTATTSATATANAGATPPTATGTKTATQRTHPKHAPPHTTASPAKPKRQKAAEAKPKREQKPSKKKAEELEVGAGSNEKAPPHRFPRVFQLRFIVSCEAGKGSNATCECILTKLEKSNVEKGQSIAELIALELELKQGVPLGRVAGLPRRVQRDTKECRSKSK
jgi:hypothetical protein